MPCQRPPIRAAAQMIASAASQTRSRPTFPARAATGRSPVWDRPARPAPTAHQALGGQRHQCRRHRLCEPGPASDQRCCHPCRADRNRDRRRRLPWAQRARRLDLDQHRHRDGDPEIGGLPHADFSLIVPSSLPSCVVSVGYASAKRGLARTSPSGNRPRARLNRPIRAMFQRTSH